MAKTKYNEDQANYFLECYKSGMTIEKICQSSKMPDSSTIYNWLDSWPNFLEKFESAKKIRAAALAESMIDIADSAVDAQKARVQVNVRQFLAGKYDRANFGDRIDVQHSHTLHIDDDLTAAVQRLQHASKEKVIDGESKTIDE